jgi:hypothetical protein
MFKQLVTPAMGKIGFLKNYRDAELIPYLNNFYAP